MTGRQGEGRSFSVGHFPAMRESVRRKVLNERKSTIGNRRLENLAEYTFFEWIFSGKDSKPEFIRQGLYSVQARGNIVTHNFQAAHNMF
jgi:hypothetical protein